MKRFLIFFLLISTPAFASDLVVPFQGVSGLCDEPMVNSDTIACYDGTLSGTDLYDHTENLVLQSKAVGTSPWIVQGNAVVTPDCAYSPDGSYTADKVYVEGSGNGIYQPSIDIGDENDPYSPSFYINRLSKIGEITVYNPNSLVGGRWTIDLSKLGDGWERVSRNHYAVSVLNEMTGYTVSGAGGIAFRMTSGTAEFYLTDVQIESGKGLYHVGPVIETTTVKKTRLDLSPIGDPSSILSDVQNANGNKLSARSFNGTDQHYIKTPDSVMDIWDSNHTVTLIIKKENSVANQTVFYNGASSLGGLYLQTRTNDTIMVAYPVAGSSSVLFYSQTNATAGAYHVVQIVRNADSSDIYVDGLKGTITDVTGAGTDCNVSLVLGSYGGSLWWPGEILYTRIDKRALSEDELSRQVDVLMGMASSAGRYSEAIWDVERTTTATQEFSNKTLATKAVDHARVGDGILVEGQSTNLVPYSQQFDQWGVLRASIIADTAEVLAPDGTQTVDIIHEDATAGSTHYTGQGSIGVEANTDYIFSVYVKPINRNWVMVEFDAASTDGFASFNLDTNYIGTAANCTAFVEDSVNGFKRVGIIWNSTTNTTVSGLLLPEEANNDTVFDGLDQDSLYVWGAQVEEGEYATSYIPTVATAVTRTADDVTLERPIAGRINWPVEPTFELDFSQDPSGATITSNTGQVLTKQGNPSRIHDNTLPDGVGGGKGYAHSFDGTNDFYTRADDGTFDPAGDFSVCAAVTPVDVSSGSQIIFGKYIRNTDDIGWYLNQYDSTFEVYVSKDGTIAMREYVNTSGGAAVAGRLAFLCATYDYKTDGTSVLRLYVDGATVLEKTDTTGPVNDSSGALFAAAFLSSGTTAEANITIHHLAYFDGYVLTADNFTNVYNQWNNLVVDAGIPPTITGPFTVEFEAKCEYADNTQISADKTLLSIDYEDANTDTFEVSIDSDGKINASLYDSTDTQHTLQSAADPVSFNEWFKVKAYMDLSDLAQNDMWINGSNTSITKTGNSGSASWSTLLSKLRLGQDYSGIAGYSDCRIRNLRLSPKRF